ncbi:MAG: nucleotidyltransferase domain-containing protein [Acidobacteriota bacterium]|nr:nucleotidyltransferase domain-containing protein [Acidobacteriota bacterium]
MQDLAIPIDKDKLRDFCHKWKITEFALFGSVVRPEDFRDDSDVDVLVRVGPDATLTFEAWLDMREELKEMFGRDVDLAERVAVEQMRNYLRRAAILETAVFLDVA